MNVGLVTAVKDVFWDSMLSLLALPPIAYQQLCTDIETIWRKLVLLLNSQKATRYIVLAWIDLKQPVKKQEVSWLARLALEGTVEHHPDVDVFGDGLARRFAAFLVSDWDAENGTLCILKMAPRSMYSSIIDGFGELVLKAVERVQADIRRDRGGGRIHWIWMWTRSDGIEGHDRIAGMPKKLGFRERREVLEGNPGLDEMFILPEGERAGSTVWVTGLADFLELLRRSRRKNAAAKK
jgi:hypothetical protein